MRKYKKRNKNTFDYEHIKSRIDGFKPGFLGSNDYFELLWIPYLYVSSKNVKQTDEYGLPDINSYSKVGVYSIPVCRIVLRGIRHLFKKDEILMRVRFDLSEKPDVSKLVNDYMNSMCNYVDCSEHKYYKFDTYEEVEACLKGLEEAVHKSGDDYFYFSEDEAKESCEEYEAKMFQLVNYEKDLVMLDNQLSQTKKTEDRQSVSLQEYVDLLNERIATVKEEIEHLYG